MKKNTAIAMGTASGVILLLFLALVLVFVMIGATKTTAQTPDGVPGVSGDAASMEAPPLPDYIIVPGTNERIPVLPPEDGPNIAPTPPPEEEMPPCEYDEWIGKTGEETAAYLKSIGATYRIIPPNTGVTMDYSPSRVNAELDDNNIVIRMFCG